MDELVVVIEGSASEDADRPSCRSVLADALQLVHLYGERG
jgi:hypothetical protein